MDGSQAANDGAFRTVGLNARDKWDDQHPKDGAKGDVALVVVTYNSVRALPPLVDSLADRGSATFSQIVFIDNASSDSTRDYIATSLPSALIIANPCNRGFAAAVNQGVAATESPFLLLANPDVSFEWPAVEALREFLNAHPSAAAVSPRLVYPDGNSQWAVRRFPTHANIWLSRQSPLRFLEFLIPGPRRYTVPDPTTAQRVDAVAATCLMVRRSALAAVGGLDEGYFLYVEDTDICKRWYSRGLEVWVDPAVTVEHNWKGGSGRDRVLRMHHRNGISRYFRIHHSDKSVRNLLLDALLTFAGWWDRLGRKL